MTGMPCLKWSHSFRGGRIRMSGFARSGHKLNCENVANGQRTSPLPRENLRAKRRAVARGVVPSSREVHARRRDRTSFGSGLGFATYFLGSSSLSNCLVSVGESARLRKLSGISAASSGLTEWSSAKRDARPSLLSAASSRAWASDAALRMTTCRRRHRLRARLQVRVRGHRVEAAQCTVSGPGRHGTGSRRRTQTARPRRGRASPLLSRCSGSLSLPAFCRNQSRAAFKFSRAATARNGSLTGPAPRWEQRGWGVLDNQSTVSGGCVPAVDLPSSTAASRPCSVE
jgi:hypothetical protein